MLRQLDDTQKRQIDFAPLYQRIEGLPEFEPGVVLPGDRVVARGSGRYHDARRASA
jgi:phenylalanine-4-hydroxylase